jgi:hypothetical protein
MNNKPIFVAFATAKLEKGLFIKIVANQQKYLETYLLKYMSVK